MKFDQLVMLLEADEGVEIKREYWDKAKKRPKLRSIEYFLNGERHRVDGPAYQYWYKNGQKGSEYYFINGKPHHTDDPAIQEWYKNGQKHTEEYLVDGNLHRIDGPARQAWRYDGQKYYEEYYINGKEVSKEEFDAYKGYSDEVHKDIDDLNLPDF